MICAPFLLAVSTTSLLQPVEDVVRIARHEYEALLADRAELQQLRMIRSSRPRPQQPVGRQLEETSPLDKWDPAKLVLNPVIARGISTSTPIRPTDWSSGANTFPAGINCSTMSDEEYLCQLQENITQGCISWAMCSLSDDARAKMMVGEWWKRSMHYLPNAPRPNTRLLLPIQKLAPLSKEEQGRTALRPIAKEYARHEHHHHGPPSSASTPEPAGSKGSGGGGGHHRHAVDDVEAAAAVVAAAPQVWRAWPARAHYEDKHMPWERYPDGELWRGCRTGNKAHWYCNHISVDYFDNTRNIFNGCIEPLGIFKRADVRLALDVGGGTGAFAEAVYKWHGDRVLVMTSQLFATENDVKYSLQFPQAGILAARGHVGVMFDMYSFFPFGESTLDVVHTSWTFHTGFPRTTLYEIFRVLRPGGYLIIRQMANTQVVLPPVRKFAAEHNWTTVFDKMGCSFDKGGVVSQSIKDTVLAFRMPLPQTWKQSAYTSSFYGGR